MRACKGAASALPSDPSKEFSRGGSTPAFGRGVHEDLPHIDRQFIRRCITLVPWIGAIPGRSGH